MTAESKKFFKWKIADIFFLATSQHRDAEYVHIHRYEKTEDGQKSFPTKKAISFPPGQWIAFYDVITDIDECIWRHKEGQSVYYHYHIGGAVYVTINDKYRHVDIRRFFYLSGGKVEQLTKSGICVTFDQWDISKTQIAKLHKPKPYLFEASCAVLQTAWSREFDDCLRMQRM